MNRHDRRQAMKFRTGADTVIRLGKAEHAMRPPPGIPVIGFATPSGGQCDDLMRLCWTNMVLYCATHGMCVNPAGLRIGCYVEENRNGIIKDFKEAEIPIDWVMWTDTDMTKFPMDTVSRLMAHGVDIVGANYRKRQYPYKYNGVFVDHDDRHCYDSGLHEVEILPTGLKLVRMSVYRKLEWPWYDASCSKARDDVYFSQIAREAGYKLWCDMDLTREVCHDGVDWYDERNAANDPVMMRDDLVETAVIPKDAGYYAA